MRPSSAGIVALLLTACGGGGATDSTKPPTTPPVTPPAVLVPAVVAVTAGDGQQAEPGATLGVKPVVVVRDAAGVVVPGVSVTFVVDSGGGSLQATSATTATDGTASPGDWRLGVAETRNVLRATVASLTPAKVFATAVVAPVTLPNQVVDASGGTITVNRPGSLINGMQIIVPAGSYTVSKNVGVSYASSASTVPPVGTSILSPLITVQGLEARASKNLTVRIPATIASGQSPSVVLRDPATGATTSATLLRWDSTSVTVLLPRINGAAIPLVPLTYVPQINAPLSTRASTAGTASWFSRTSSASVSAPDTPAQLYVIAIPDAEIFKNRVSDFTLAEDAWNFPAIPTVEAAFTFVGMTSTALYWYLNMKEIGSLKANVYLGGVWGNVPYGSWKAMRLVSFAVKNLGDGSSATPISPDPAYDAGRQVEWRSIAANMLASLNRPIPVILEATDGELRTVMVYAISGLVMLAYDPVIGNGQPGALIFSANHVFLGYDIPGENTPGRWKKLLAHAVYSFYDDSVMRELFKASTSPTFGNDRWPTTVLRSQFDTVGRARDTVWVSDTLTVWTQCATCVGQGVAATFNPDPAPPRGEVLPAWMYYLPSGANALPVPLVPATTSNLKGGFRLSTGLPKVTAARFISFGLCGPAPKVQCWIDSRGPDYLYQSTLLIDAPTQPVGTGSSIPFSVSGDLLPNGAEFEWDFNDGTAPINSVQIRSVSHTFSTAATRRVTVRALHPATRQIVAVATVDVVVKAVLPVWKFTSITLVIDSSGPNPWVSNPIYGVGPEKTWNRFVQMFTNLKNGVTQGGLLYIARDTVFPDAAYDPTGPSSVKNKGLYIVDGVSLTLSTIAARLSLPDETTAILYNGGNQVRGSWWVSRQPAPRVADNPLWNERYTETGSITAGTTVGTYWEITQSEFRNGQNLYFPFRVRAADVAFAGDIATGTLTFVQRDYEHVAPIALPKPETRNWSIRVTFQAERMR